MVTGQIQPPVKAFEKLNLPATTNVKITIYLANISYKKYRLQLCGTLSSHPE